MNEPVDQPTRDLVSRLGLARTLFVEAGAGTGKTTQLVDRITNLVLEHDVRLTNIAAITFTEAAAAELQTRIRVQFERRAAAATSDDERRKCRDALADADLAAVTTLHGFASRMLGEFAVQAGLPPRVRVLDEVASQLAHEDRWARFVDALYDDPANEAVLVRAALVGVALEPRYPGHATFKDVAVELNQNWDRLGPIAEQPPAAIGPLDFRRFDDAVAAVADLPAECLDPSDLLYAHLTRIIDEMRAVVAIDDPQRKLRLLDSVTAKPWGRGNGGKKAAWRCEVKAAKDLIDEVNTAARDIKQHAADEVIRHLLTLISREVLDAALARRDEGGLEFHDLLVLALQMLRSSADARSTLHERYTHILLDEFQDTDPLQIELATLIAASIEGAPVDRPLVETWKDLQVAEGRLFFVGDPKQSIYRFRRADIRLFLAARDRFGPGDTVAKLTTNFRTVAPILDWVNALFDSAMPEELEDQQPKYEALSAWRAADSGADHRPVLLGGPNADPKVRAGALRELEAADVARTVADVRARPDAWPVLDERNEQWRPARLADVTILVPTRTSLPYLREALEREAIPYRLATGTLVYDTQEVRDALAAVRAVDDPTDQLSLAAALRSPLYACSDVDLFTFRAAGGRWDLRREPPETVPLDHPVRAALAHLRTLWEQRWWLTPSALLERLLRERQAFLLAFGDARPAEVWRRLRFLVDQARAFEEAGGGALRDFVAWAALQSADSARVHEPLLDETDDDAVRILTIHGAKGLEFPITILSGMTTQAGGNRQGVSVLWDETGPPEVRLRKGVATENHDPRADIEVEMDKHEKLRLLYVAATRARDHLVVSCHHSTGGRGASAYGASMWTFFADRTELWRRLPEPDESEPAPAPPTSASVAEVAAVVDDRDGWIQRREALLAPQRRPRTVSATRVAREAAVEPTGEDTGGYDSDDDRADDVDDAVVTVRRQGRAGSAIGRAVHATLQLIDLGDPGDLDAQVRRQCDLESVPEHVGVVAAMVRSALDSAAVRLAVANVHHKELYVAAPVGDRLVEGYIDLLVETAGGLVVIDYKTDSANTEAEIDAKLAAYELQGASYAVALERVVGQPVVECRFVFCKPRGAIERSVGDLDAAKARVRAAVSAR